LKRVLIFGDSNSWGYTDQDNGYRYEKRWPVLLNQELIQKGINIEILEDCLPGRTTNIDDLQDGTHLNGAKVLKSSLLSHSPIDFVLILLGTNDLKVRFQRSAENIADGIKELIQIVFETNSGTGSWHDQNKSKLIIICPPILGKKSHDSSWVNFKEWEGAHDKSKKLYSSFKKVCREMGVDLIDANKFCQSSDIDPIHWSKHTHLHFSEELAKIIEQKIKL
jgi:hypothetical protein